MNRTRFVQRIVNGSEKLNYKLGGCFFDLCFFDCAECIKSTREFIFRVEMWCLKFKAGSKYTPKNFIAGVASVEVTHPSTLIRLGKF